MKNILAAFVLVTVSLFSQFSLAREPKAALFGETAMKLTTAAYGHPGDTVSVEQLLQQRTNGNGIIEIWKVLLQSGGGPESASYQVTIFKADKSEDLSVRFKNTTPNGEE